MKLLSMPARFMSGDPCNTAVLRFDNRAATHGYGHAI